MILLVSGCVSYSPISPASPTSPIPPTPIQSGIVTTQPSADFTYQYPPDPSHWIEVDPVSNFQIGSGLNSTIIPINITGTTNLPVNSLLFIEPYWYNPYTGDEEKVPISDIVVPVENNGGSDNTFFYSITMTIPGEYRIAVRRWNVTNSTHFTVLGKDPLPWVWIRIDPIGKYHPGETINITGITNLPAGSEITVKCEPVNVFPCPIWASDNPSNFSGTICGGHCHLIEINKRIRVDSADGGNASWVISVNTTGWCTGYRWSIRALKAEWDNVSPDSEDLGFYSE